MANRSPAATRRNSKPTQRVVGRPKGSNGEERRGKILDAARQCFSEFGYAASSNADIARLAGITAGSIYYYFETKREMFLAAHQEIQDVVVQRCFDSIAGHTKLSEAIDSLLDELLRLQLEMPSFGKFSAVVRTEAARNPDLQSARQDAEWRSLYSDLAKIGIKSGEIDETNERAMRCVFATLVFGITQHGAEASPESHREAMRGVKLLFQGSLISAPDK